MLRTGPGACVNMLPVERDAGLIDPTTSTPSQPVDERNAAPRRLQEARRLWSKGDVDPGRGAAAVGAELVRRGRPPLTR